MSKEVQKWLCEYDANKDMILNIYPDCQNMNKDDPRKNYLDSLDLTQIAENAFPIGLELKYSTERPSSELLPMIHNFSDETVYMQYLVFYESLAHAYYPAF